MRFTPGLSCYRTVTHSKGKGDVEAVFHEFNESNQQEDNEGYVGGNACWLILLICYIVGLISWPQY